MVQLDSLRALAVFAVMYQHFYSDKMPTLFNRPLYWGSVGVELFYVLSGFLITGILLKYKDSIEAKNETLITCLKKFYYRRTLRIFPIYYLLLATIFILSVDGVRETVFWHFCYLSNVYSASVGKWPPTNINHFWSLAVEEQFYLFWPWLILLVPRKHLLTTVTMMICSGPLYRFTCLYVVGASKFTTDVLTPGCLDLLGMGALLALLKNKGLPFEKYKDTVSQTGLIVGGTLALAMFMAKAYAINNLFIIFFRFFEGLFFLWLVDKTSDGLKGISGKVLEVKPLIYLGKISYGIYLYHNLVPLMTRYFLSILAPNYALPDEMSFFINSIVTVALASVSWFLIESPIQQLKNRCDTNSPRITNTSLDCNHLVDDTAPGN
jgi:peptidoglycan/LPS O-acetylase OafA/YrhL